MFLMSGLFTILIFMSISLVFAELWQFLLMKDLTRNPKIGNTRVWVLSNFWRPGQVRDTKFGMNVSNEYLLNAAKFQVHSFYSFWVIILRANQQELKIPPPRLDLKWYPNNCPSISVGVWVKVKVSFKVGGTTRQLLLREIAPRLGLGLGSGFVLGCFGVGDRVFLLELIKVY